MPDGPYFRSTGDTDTGTDTDTDTTTDTETDTDNGSTNTADQSSPDYGAQAPDMGERVASEDDTNTTTTGNQPTDDAPTQTQSQTESSPDPVDTTEQTDDGDLDAPGGRTGGTTSTPSDTEAPSGTDTTTTESAESSASNNAGGQSSDRDSPDYGAQTPDMGERVFSEAETEAAGTGTQSSGVTREVGAPQTDTKQAQQSLTKAAQAVMSKTGLDRDDFRLTVTDNGNVEFGGLTKTGRRDMLKQRLKDRGAESVDLAGSGDNLRVEDVTWGDQPERMEMPGGGPDFTNEQRDLAALGETRGQDRRQRVGSGGKLGEDLIEQEIERANAGLDVEVGRNSDGGFDVDVQDVHPSTESTQRRASTAGQLGEDLVEQQTETSTTDVEVGRDQTGDFTVESDQKQRAAVNQDSLAGAVADVEQATGVDVPGEGPLVTNQRTSEQFGDADLSLGLGGKGDEVEQAANEFSRTVSQTASDVGKTLFEGDGVASESAGEELLQAAGYEDLGQQYEQSLSKFGQGVVTGAAGLVGSVPSLAVEETEAAAFTAQNPVTAAERVPGAVARRGVSMVESGLENPAKMAGALVGSEALSAGVFKATQGTRFGTAARVALQPGEELVKAGIKRGVLGSRAARVTPGVTTSQVEGETNSGTTTATSGSGSGRMSDLADRIGKFRREVSQRTPNVRVERNPDAGVVEVEPAARAQAASEVRKAKKSLSETPAQIAERFESGAESVVQRTRELDAQLGAQAAVARRSLSDTASSVRDSSPGQAARDMASDAGSRFEMSARRTIRDVSETAENTRIGAKYQAERAGDRAKETPDRVRQAAARTRRRASDLPADIGLTAARVRGELATRLDDRPSIGSSSTGSADVFGRPSQTSDLLDRFDSAGTDLSDEVDLGRPLSTDLNTESVSERAADVLPDGRPSMSSLPDPRDYTVKVEASRPQRLYTPEGEGQPMTSGVVDFDEGFAVETTGDTDTSTAAGGGTDRFTRAESGRGEMQGTQASGQDAVVRTRPDSESRRNTDTGTDTETKTAVETDTRPEARAGAAGGLTGTADEPTLDDGTDTALPAGGETGMDAGFDSVFDTAESPTSFDETGVDATPDVDSGFDVGLDTESDTSTDISTELDQTLNTETDQTLGLNQDLGRELEQELESEQKSETESKPFLPDEEDRQTDRGPDAGMFSEGTYSTGIADVEDLKNRDFSSN